MDKKFDDLLSQYEEKVYARALQVRKLLMASFPGVTEQVDAPAKMVAYCYGQKYIEMLCTIIPSKKGLKLGFAYGPDLPDPERLLEGKGKISRYIEIKSDEQLKSPALKKLLAAALAAYKKRVDAKR